MHLGIKNFVGSVKKYLFGDGSYSQNVIQGGSTLQPQASYLLTSDIMPVATGANTGGWVFSASTYYPPYAPWGAAEGTNGNASGGQINVWQTGDGYLPAWWQVQAPSPVKIGGYALTMNLGNAAQNPTAWTLQASKTGAFAGEQVTLDSRSGFSGALGTRYVFQLTNPVDDSFSYFRIVITAAGGTYIMLGEVELFPPLVQNAVVVTSTATVAPDAETGAAVVVCDRLVIDGGTLNPSTNCKGLLVFAKSGVSVINGGKLNIDKLGKAGNFGNLTVLDLVPAALKRKLKSSLASYVVLGEGAAGGAKSQTSSGYTYYSGNNGLPAGAMQSGGGGGGHAYAGNMGATIGGAGGKGGPCCGGAGGGAAEGTGMGGDASPYGGPGGAGSAYDHNACGGAGNPPGYNDTGSYTITFQSGAGGGLLMLFTPSLSIASGCIVSADGSPGSNVSGTCMAGSGAGGGIVCLFTPAGGYANNGTVRANGGAGGVGYNYSGIVPGAGGAGSVNTFTIN